MSNLYDVVICYHRKDKPTVEFCLKGCFENLNPRKIYILTNIKNIPFFKKYPKVKVIDENSFFNDLNQKLIIRHWLKKNFRLVHKTPCWLYQQLLKIAASYKIKGLSDNYLILDADTVFLNKVKMMQKGKALISPASECHQPYFTCMEKLLNFKPQRKYSFISHHQLVNKKLMIKMLKRICSKKQSNWQNQWYKIILGKYDYQQKNGFSEYETYGHFLKSFYPKSFKVRNLCWKNLRQTPNQRLLDKLTKKFDFICFHTSWRKPKIFGLNYFSKLISHLSN